MYISKRYIYFFAGVTGILIIVIISLILTQQSLPSSRDELLSQSIQQDQLKKAEGVDKTPFAAQQGTSILGQTSPEETALGFYLWYVKSTSPLISGEYQARQDITPEYKGIMTAYVKRGIDPQRDPVFNCSKALIKNIAAKTALFDDSKAMALVMLQDNNIGGNLFQIKLQKNYNGLWKVRDVWCAP